MAEDSLMSLRDWPSSDGPGRPAAGSDRTVSLAGLQRRGVSLEWFEAVAIAQGFCEAVIQSGDCSGPATADLDAVFIDALGGVAAASDGPQPVAAAIQCAGAVFAGILPANDFMHLSERVVAKAISSPPAYASLEQLSDALAYYERPNRTQLIQEVFQRWESLPAPAAELAPPPRPVAPSPKRKRTEGSKSTSRYLEWGMVVALIIVLIAGGIALWRFWIRSSGSRPTVASNAEAPATAEAEQPVSGIGTKKTPATPNENAPSSTPRLVSRLIFHPELPVPELPLGDTGGGTANNAPPDAPVPDVVPPAEVTPPRRIDADGKSATYSANDETVAPPTVVYPQSLSQTTATTAREDVLIVEVLVNELGRVDWAKAIDHPRNLGESLVLTNALSATKTWRFNPAMKEGVPVKYRELIAVAIH
jgi:hypothetical protein